MSQFFPVNTLTAGRRRSASLLILRLVSGFEGLANLLDFIGSGVGHHRFRAVSLAINVKGGLPSLNLDSRPNISLLVSPRF